MAPDAQTFRRAEAIRRQAKKAIDKWTVNQCQTEEESIALRDELYQRELRSAIHEFKEVLVIQKRLNEVYEEVMGEDEKVAKQWYHITVRPDSTKLKFSSFYEKVRGLMDRLCFIEYTLSFEQTGEAEEQLGSGFHVHIVANTTHKSKGQVVRDMKSSFKDYCKAGIMKPECIDVEGSRTPKQLIDSYLTEYKSADGHKELLKEWDARWRESLGLLPLYKGVVPPLSFNKPGTDKGLPDSRPGTLIQTRTQTVNFD